MAHQHKIGHSVPIEQHIKIACITYKTTISTNQPAYYNMLQLLQQ